MVVVVVVIRMGLGSIVNDDVMIGDPSRTSAMTVQVPVKEVSSGPLGFKWIPQEEFDLDIQTSFDIVLKKQDFLQMRFKFLCISINFAWFYINSKSQ